LAFKAVRELMMQILSIKVKNKSAAFHNLLMNFLAWLSDKRSLYFDQLLLTMLSKIVLQLKRKLVQELKDRSIKVVSLTTTKIIIDSQKKTLQPAIDYFEYVSQVLSSIELFKEVSLAGSPRFWRFLMYQSPQKYIGLEHDQTVFEFCWKEIELLPAALKDQLLYHLSTFMVDLLDTFQNIIAQANEESGEM
jgi:hypothetical protein